MVVYLDVIWLLNLIVDCLLLWITAIFLKSHTNAWRIFCGGFVGSLLILASVTPYGTVVNHPLIKLATSICMILIVFGFKRLKYFLTCLLTFYFSTFLMGGILVGTHYFLTFDLDLRTAVLLDSVRGFGDPISWVFVMIAFPFAWHFSRNRVASMTSSSIEYDRLMDVHIQLNGRTIQSKGLIDSGNQLYDPISNAPVMIVSIAALSNKDELPAEVLFLADEKNDPYEVVSQMPAEWSSKMRFIPAKSLGRNGQLLCAFKPDSITLKDEEVERIVQKALIVFTTQQLSSDGQFQCIIHPQMVSMAVKQTAS